MVPQNYQQKKYMRFGKKDGLRKLLIVRPGVIYGQEKEVMLN